MSDYMVQEHERHEQWQERQLKKRPVCDICGEPIQDDHYYECETNFVYCHDCFEEWVHDNLIRIIN